MAQREASPTAAIVRGPHSFFLKQTTQNPDQEQLGRPPGEPAKQCNFRLPLEREGKGTGVCTQV